jgi:hypothetical protein
MLSPPPFGACEHDRTGHVTRDESDVPAFSQVVTERKRRSGSDARILWVGPGEEEPTATQAPLFHEHVFPVCSPKFIPNKRPLRNPQGLATMPLLHKATHATGEWSWKVWLDRLSVEVEKRRKGKLRFADRGLLLSAAVGGSDVGLARSLPGWWRRRRRAWRRLRRGWWCSKVDPRHGRRASPGYKCERKLERRSTFSR